MNIKEAYTNLLAKLTSENIISEATQNALITEASAKLDGAVLNEGISEDLGKEIEDAVRDTVEKATEKYKEELKKVTDQLAEAKKGKKGKKPSKTRTFKGDIGSPEHKAFLKGSYFEKGELTKRGEKTLKTVNSGNNARTYKYAVRKRRELGLTPDLTVEITAKDLMKALEKK